MQLDVVYVTSLVLLSTLTLNHTVVRIRSRFFKGFSPAQPRCALTKRRQDVRTIY
jgi:hypothetical protein